MREIAVVVSNDNEKVTPFETIDAIKEAGFKNVFVQWYNKDWEYKQEEQLQYINKLGLNVIFAHLGYQGINSIWEFGKEGDLLVERYNRDIDICKNNNVPMLIMHLTSKSIAPEFSTIGLDRLRKITTYARRNNIKIAFENTKIERCLEYVLRNICDGNVGICFDSGHCHVHFNDKFNFDSYKNRIFAVHLHDNDKSDDLHLIPYDGTIDWDWVVDKLSDCNYDGPITLEPCYRYDYTSLSLSEFYKKGYAIGEKIAKMFDEKDIIKEHYISK